MRTRFSRCEVENVSFPAGTDFLARKAHPIVPRIDQRLLSGFPAAHLSFFAEEPIEDTRLKHWRPASGDDLIRLSLIPPVHYRHSHFRRIVEPAALERIVL